MLMHLPACSQGLAPGGGQEYTAPVRGCFRCPELQTILGHAAYPALNRAGNTLPAASTPWARNACPAAVPLPHIPARRTQRALIHILAAGWPRVARGTGADGFAIDRVSVTVRALIARVADAGVVQVAEQTWVGWQQSARRAPRPGQDRPPTATLLSGPNQAHNTQVIPRGYNQRACPGHTPGLRPSRRAPLGPSQGALLPDARNSPAPSSLALTRAAVGTLAVEGGHAVVTCGTVEAGGAGTIVDVLTAVLTSPAIDAHAVVASMRVVAGPTVLAGVGHQLTLVHVLSTVLTYRHRDHQAGRMLPGP